MTKVSFVIPVYNTEKYLRKCVNSILKQTYQPFEIILVDDGSTDNSGSICDSLAKGSNIVKVTHKNNAGLGMARNTGLELCSGEYVVFIDSDDWVDSNFLERIINKKNKYGVDTIISGLKRVDQYDNVVRIENKYQEEHFVGDDIREELLPRIIGRSPEKRDSLGVSSCAVLYSLRLIKDNNIRFVSERDFLSEDLLFNMDYFSIANNALISPIYGYNYLVNTNTLSTSYRDERSKKYIALYREEKKRLKKNKLFDQCKLRLSAQFFLRIRNCIKQENTKISGFSFKTAISNIRSICNEPLYISMIKTYPVKKLDFKRRVFLWLVSHKKPMILYFLTRFM